MFDLIVGWKFVPQLRYTLESSVKLMEEIFHEGKGVMYGDMLVRTI